MVKPEILWAYAKTSQNGDELFLGKLLRHLAGHEVELSATERLAANALMQSNEWHTENIETKKERDALYQRINRLEKLLKEHGIEIPKKSNRDNKCQIDKPLSISLPHSPAHSPTHSKDERECGGVETLSLSQKSFSELTETDAVEAGRKAKLSDDVARQLFRELTDNGGGYQVGKNFVEVTGKNLQSALKTMSRHIKQQSAAMPKPKIYTCKDWELCKDWCANYKRGGGCMRGVEVPPDLNETRKHHPNECGNFSPKPEDAKA